MSSSTVVPNKLLSIVNRINSTAPTFLRSPLLSYVFDSNIKYAGTTGIEIVEWNTHQVVVNLKNRRKIQNHLGGIHATAMATLAESTSGMIFGIHLNDTTHIPLLKRMEIQYVKRAIGDLQAVATITQDQIDEIQTTSKGSSIIQVNVTDDTGNEPIKCEMEWAWTTKKSKK